MLAEIGHSSGFSNRSGRQKKVWLRGFFRLKVGNLASGLKRQKRRLRATPDPDPALGQHRAGRSRRMEAKGIMKGAGHEGGLEAKRVLDLTEH